MERPTRYHYVLRVIHALIGWLRSDGCNKAEILHSVDAIMHGNTGKMR